VAFLFPRYFPFCVYEGNTYEVGVGTAWPIGMSLDDAMFFYWKAKTFQITENWHSQSDVGTAVVGVTSGYGEKTLFIGSGNKMSDVSCANTYQIMTALAGQFTITFPGDPPVQYQFRDFLTFDLFVGSPQVIKIGNLYYPQITFRRDGGYYPYLTWSTLRADSSDSGVFAFNATLHTDTSSYILPVYTNSVGTTFIDISCDIYTYDQTKRTAE
jgi:hypothetical protein